MGVFKLKVYCLLGCLRQEHLQNTECFEKIILSPGAKFLWGWDSGLEETERNFEDYLNETSYDMLKCLLVFLNVAVDESCILLPGGRSKVSEHESGS